MKHGSLVPKWHFAKTNFLASAISDRATRARETLKATKTAAQTLFRHNEGLSQLVRNTKYDGKAVTQKPPASKPPRERLARSLSFYSTSEGGSF